MMKSWDFVDPKLAQKYHEITQEIKDLKAKRIEIKHNSKLSISAKQKLLAYNDECLQDLQRIMNKHKEEMADYFDEQVYVLTQKEVKNRNSNTRDINS